MDQVAPSTSRAVGSWSCGDRCASTSPVTTTASTPDAWSSSAVARACFGDEVVDHYTRMAEVELTAFDAAVTDWELRRSFERM